MSEPIDYDAIDTRVRRLVRWLNEQGYETTDSGDGSKAPEMDCALDVPHVFIVTSGEQLVADSNFLFSDLLELGVVVEAQGPGEKYIQATYDPGDGSAIIALYGVSDTDLPSTR